MNHSEIILFIIGAYVLVVLLYVTWILFISAFADAFPFSYLVAIGYLIYIMFGHLSVIAYWRLNQTPKKEDRNHIKRSVFCKVITLWFGVLLNGPGIKEAGDGISKFHAKFYWIVYPIEVAILLLYIVLFGFYLDNAFRIVSYVFFLILLISVSFHRFRKVHGYWLVLFAALPVILLWCIFFGLCFCCIIFMIMFCKAIFNVSSKDNKKDITLGGLLKMPVQEFLYDAKLFALPSDLYPEEVIDARFEDLPEDHGGINQEVHKSPEAKSIKTITKEVYDNTEPVDKSVSCLVCRETLKRGESIIKIQGCSLEIVHFKCIGDFKDNFHLCRVGNKELNWQSNNRSKIYQPVKENKV